MRLRIPSPFLVLLALFVYSPCMAETAIPPRLSLDQAVSLALRTNVSMKQAETSRQDALSRLYTTNIGVTYQVGADTSLRDYSYGDTHDNEWSGGLSSGATYSNLLGTSASVSWSPLSFGDQNGRLQMQVSHPLMRGRGRLSRRFDEVEAAKTGLSIQEEQFHLSTQSTIVRVVNAYYRALLAEQQVKVQESALDTAKVLLEGTQKREEAGLATGIEVSRAQIRVQEASNQLVIQQERANAAMDRLMLAIGSGVGQKTELVDDVPEPGALPELPDLREAVATALDNRAELSVYDRRLREQERRLAISGDQFLPSLDLVAGLTSGGDSSARLSGFSFDSRDMNVGFRVAWPLDRRIIREEKAHEQRQLTLLKDQRTNETEAITEQVRESYRGVLSTKESLEIYERNLATARQSMRQAERMMEEGLSDNRDLLESNDAVTRAELGLQSAKVDLYLARINLMYAMGEDLAMMGAR